MHFFFNINVIRMSYWHKVLRDTISRKLFFYHFNIFFLHIFYRSPADVLHRVQYISGCCSRSVHCKFEIGVRYHGNLFLLPCSTWTFKLVEFFSLPFAAALCARYFTINAKRRRRRVNRYREISKFFLFICIAVLFFLRKGKASCLFYYVRKTENVN